MRCAQYSSYVLLILNATYILLLYFAIYSSDLHQMQFKAISKKDFVIKKLFGVYFFMGDKLGVIAIEKGAFGLPSTMVANFTYLL